MSLALDQWYLFPTSILIATIAMTSGIGGAVFFAPLFIIVLKLEPAVAVGTALTTELFGFSSGVIVYWRRRLIAVLLKAVFAVGVMFIGWEIFRSRHANAAGRFPGAGAATGRESVWWMPTAASSATRSARSRWGSIPPCSDAS